MVKQAVLPITGSRQVSVDSSFQSIVPSKWKLKFCGQLQLEEKKQERASRVLAYSTKQLSLTTSLTALVPGVLRSLPTCIYLSHLSFSSYCWGLSCLVSPTNPTFLLKKWRQAPQNIQILIKLVYDFAVGKSNSLKGNSSAHQFKLRANI